MKVERMKKYRAILMIALATLALVSCEEKDDHIIVNEDQVIGLWLKSGSQEYWRYNADHTGASWDESEDISDVETNMSMTWSLDGDQLTHVFTGAMNNQMVPKVYTISSISSSTMVWTDGYYNSRITLHKVVEGDGI